MDTITVQYAEKEYKAVVVEAGIFIPALNKLLFVHPKAMVDFLTPAPA